VEISLPKKKVSSFMKMCFPQSLFSSIIQKSNGNLITFSRGNHCYAKFRFSLQQYIITSPLFGNSVENMIEIWLISFFDVVI